MDEKIVEQITKLQKNVGQNAKLTNSLTDAMGSLVEVTKELKGRVEQHEEAFTSIKDAFEAVEEALNKLVDENQQLKLQNDCLQILVLDLAKKVGVSGKALGNAKRKITNYQKKKLKSELIEELEKGTKNEN